LPPCENGEYFPLTFARGRVEQVTRHRLQKEPVPR
jgi:hypothetical protein